MSWNVLYATPGSVVLLPGAGAVTFSGHAPSISAGGSLSSLATLVSGMTAGTWSTWSGGFISSTITSSAGDDPVISNGAACHWDPVRSWIQYFGHGHTGGLSRVLDFVDSTGAWGNTNPPPFPTNATDLMHQFLGQTMDSVTGDLYWWDTNHSPAHVWRRVGTSWTDLGLSPQGSHGQGNGAAFNPHYGTAGGAFFGGFYGIDVWDVGTGAYTNLYNGSGLTLGDPSALQQCYGYYDSASQAVYFATTAGSVNSKAVVRVSKTGVTTQMSALPVTVALNTSTALSAGQIVDGYISTSTISGQNTSGTVRKPLLITPSGAMRTYDSTGDSWALISGVTNPDATDANNGMIMGVCPAYDCVFLFGQTDSAGSMTAHVYKRSVND